MTFFDSKEDVIQIELTPHGRRLLSKGKLKPVFYNFYDDDILYESEYGGFTENNSVIKTRILDETPYMRTKNCFDGIDTNLNKRNVADDSRSLKNEIGSMPINLSKSPAWEIHFLQGELSGSKNFMSSSKNNILQIPQLECEIEYTMSIDNEANYNGIPNRDDYIFSETKLDGSFVSIKQETLLLDVLEKNGFDYKDAFDIEVYIYEYDGTQNRCSPCSGSNDEYTLRKLNFAQRDRTIVNGYLIPQYDSLPIDMDLAENATPNDVEYYLDISIDNNISEFEICKSLNELKARNIYLDVGFDCNDLIRTTSDLDINLYGDTRADIEDCE